MKNKILVLLIAASLLHSFVFGQTLAMNSANYIPDYTSSNFVSNAHKKTMCTATKIGLVTIGGGVVLIVYGGILSSNHHDTFDYTGLGEEIGGLALIFLGGVITIGGGIYDQRAHQIHKWSIIAPKMNQVGLAYNL